MSARRGEVDDRLRAPRCDLGRGELVGDVADRAGQREDQRRHRQDREERRLRGQPGDAVAHAGADRRRRPAARACRGPGPVGSDVPARPAPPSSPWPLRYPHGDVDLRASDEPGAAAGRPQRRHRPTPRWSRPSPATRPPRCVDDLVALGAEAGTAEAREHGMLANEHHAAATPYDRYGNRIDEVALPPVLALADGARGRPRPGRGAVGVSDVRRTRTSGGRPGSWRGRRPSPGTAARSR